MRDMTDWCRWAMRFAGTSKGEKVDEDQDEEQGVKGKKWILRDVNCECRSGEVLAM
jgi:hypothetical protein